MPWDGMGDVGGQPAQLICSPALVHSKTAALVCRGIARMMQGSDGWEMARGAARMIHSNTEGQSGSSKVKVRERVNKSPNPLISENVPQKVTVQMCCMKWCCSMHKQLPAPWGSGAQDIPTPVSDRPVVPARQSTGVCIHPCQSQPHSHNKRC